jgi:hypothetical protein
MPDTNSSAISSEDDDPVTPGNLRFHAQALRKRILGMEADGYDDRDIRMLRRTEGLLRRTADHLQQQESHHDEAPRRRPRVRQ